MLAPSVGHAQPWRFVKVESSSRRAGILANFEAANTRALQGYAGEKRAAYARLKLAGLAEAPVQLAVLCDESTAAGSGLGRQTMPQMMPYSVVCAIHTLWLAARMHGLGCGWISILDPESALRTLDAPPGHSLIAYLCLGWPERTSDAPELEQAGWQSRLDPSALIWTC